jgi:hypothetical protein
MKFIIALLFACVAIALSAPIHDSGDTVVNIVVNQNINTNVDIVVDESYEPTIHDEPVVHHESSPNSTCKMCHFIVDIIRHDANVTNSTLQKILNAAEAVVCAVAPPVVCHQCEEVVNATEAILNMITKGFNDTQICEKLHFCNSTITVDTSPQLGISAHIKSIMDILHYFVKND